MYYNPDAIWSVYRAVTVPSKEMSGIMGNDQHFREGGYHVPRNACPPGDYSIILPADKVGDGNAASALDIKFSAADMKLVSQRLLTAARGNDPRLTGMREFFGSVDGKKVIGWDRHDPANSHDDTPTTSDDTHLWHVHISFYRRDCNNAALLLKIAAVINGIPYVPVHRPPTTKQVLHRVWPKYMGPGDYFGLESGPPHSHGGHYPSERADVGAIQARLNSLGAHLIVDQRFGPATKVEVAAWQRKHMPHTQYLGQVWSDDWNGLFVY